MRIIFFFLFCLLLACTSGGEKAPPPEKGLLLNPLTDTIPEQEIIGPDEDDDLGSDELHEEETHE